MYRYKRIYLDFITRYNRGHHICPPLLYGQRLVYVQFNNAEIKFSKKVIVNTNLTKLFLNECKKIKSYQKKAIKSVDTE